MVWSVCEKKSEFMVETEEEDILGSLPCCRTSRHFTDTFLFSLCFFLYINRKTEAHVLFSPLLKNHGGYKLLLSTVKHWNLWVTTLTGLTSRGIIWLGEPEALSLLAEILPLGCKRLKSSTQPWCSRGNIGRVLEQPPRLVLTVIYAL